tara:strand:+ start:142 stop:624 length:483 start_codon:yes stop_codon:yes gene_type:complete
MSEPAPKRARVARVEVVVKEETPVTVTDLTNDLVCPCNPCHVYKNQNGWNAHLKSKTHIAHEKWKKNFVSNLEKNSNIKLNQQDREIQTLKSDLAHTTAKMGQTFQSWQKESITRQQTQQQLQQTQQQLQLQQQWNFEHNQHEAACVHAIPETRRFFPWL